MATLEVSFPKPFPPLIPFILEFGLSAKKYGCVLRSQTQKAAGEGNWIPSPALPYVAKYKEPTGKWLVTLPALAPTQRVFFSWALLRQWWLPVRLQSQGRVLHQLQRLFRFGSAKIVPPMTCTLSFMEGSGRAVAVAWEWKQPSLA